MCAIIHVKLHAKGLFLWFAIIHCIDVPSNPHAKGLFLWLAIIHCIDVPFD
jgi:hypothetical protein